MHFISTIPDRIGTVSYSVSVFCVAVSMYAHPPERVRFGAFELDLSTGELRSIEATDPGNPGPNNRVLLREQVFQVLRMLVERDGKIVTREEIKSRLWANDTIVDFEHDLMPSYHGRQIRSAACGCSLSQLLRPESSASWK